MMAGELKDPGYTAVSVKPSLDLAKAAFDKAEKALANATVSNRAALKKTRNDAKTALDEAQKRFDVATQFEQNTAASKTSNLSRLKDEAQRKYNLLNQFEALYKRDPNNDKKFTDYQNALTDFKAAYDPYIAAGGKPSAEVGKYIVAPAEAGAGVGAFPAGATRSEREEPAMPNPTQPVDETTKTDTSTVKNSTAVATKAFVDAELVARKLKDTPANRALLRKEYKTKGSTGGAGSQKQVTDMAWMDEFKSVYPSYSDWTTTEVINHFGQDFVDILKEAVNTEFTDEEIQSRIKGTKYFKAVSQSQYDFDRASDPAKKQLISLARDAVIKDYSDVGLSETDLTELAGTIARNGLTTAGVKQAVYRYAFRKPEASTTFFSTAMAQNALQGGTADAVRQAAGAYGYKVSDAEMQALLTGEMYNNVSVTKDSILQKAQKLAKGSYGHLADQIDSGLSLDDIFGNYRNYAANILEIDPNQIDFTKDTKWAKAFGSKESGQMSLTDWVTELKTNKDYGYQFTKKANSDATDVALMLARAFGKVK